MVNYKALFKSAFAVFGFAAFLTMVLFACYFDSGRLLFVSAILLIAHIAAIRSYKLYKKPDAEERAEQHERS